MSPVSAPRTTRFLLGLLLCLPACSDADAGAGPAADSVSWQVAEQPRVAIGNGGSPQHELDRVFGGLVLGDGSIVIGNSGTAELRIFASDGTHRRTAGRSGRGPGEFQSINWMHRRGDSVLVFDARAQRFSVWSAEGMFGRALRIESLQGFVWPVGVFPDGSILVAQENQYDPRGEPGVVRDQMVLFRIDPLGTAGPALGRFPGAEWLLYPHTSSFRSAQLPFGRKGHVAVSGESIVYGSSDSAHLSLYSAEGTVVRRIAVPAPATAIRREAVREHLAQTRDPSEREALRRHLDAQPALAAPRFLDLVADGGGNIWMQLPSQPGSTHSKWLVIDLTGTVIGSAILPATSLPLDIDSDAMLVRETDDDGVQRVSLRGLVR